MTPLNTQSNLTSNSFGIDNSFEKAESIYQNLNSETRLQQYQLEQQHHEIQTLKDKIELLELHEAAQVGQDKIIGFMVGAIVLSLLSLATSIFFSPSKQAQIGLRSEVVETNVKLDI